MVVMCVFVHVCAACVLCFQSYLAKGDIGSALTHVSTCSCESAFEGNLYKNKC